MRKLQLTEKKKSVQDSTLRRRLKLEFNPNLSDSKVHVIKHSIVMLHFV